MDIPTDSDHPSFQHDAEALYSEYADPRRTEFAKDFYRMQGEMKHLATTFDLEKVRSEFYKKMAGDLRWFISTVGLALMITISALGLMYKFFDVKESQSQTTSTSSPTIKKFGGTG